MGGSHRVSPPPQRMAAGRTFGFCMLEGAHGGGGGRWGWRGGGLAGGWKSAGQSAAAKNGCRRDLQVTPRRPLQEASTVSLSRPAASAILLEDRQTDRQTDVVFLYVDVSSCGYEDFRSIFFSAVTSEIFNM